MTPIEPTPALDLSPTCPLCHTVDITVTPHSLQAGAYWASTRCGQTWDAARYSGGGLRPMWRYTEPCPGLTPTSPRNNLRNGRGLTPKRLQACRVPRTTKQRAQPVPSFTTVPGVGNTLPIGSACSERALGGPYRSGDA